MNCEELWKKYSKVRSLPPSRRYHCPQCGVILLNSDLAQHEGHGTRADVTDEQLLEPTCLVTPKDNKKSQAVRLSFRMYYYYVSSVLVYYNIFFYLQQFYFSESSLHLLCSELRRLKFSHVLCIGTPRFD